MQVISFVNMKGGVGKTTLAVNVAYGLAYMHKKKVLIVDSDPQFNATQYLLQDDAYLRHINDDAKGTLKDVFMTSRAGPVSTTRGTAKKISTKGMSLAQCSCSIFSGGVGRGKLDLVPSSLALMEIETSPRQTEAKLKIFLREKAQDYDYVIIDCPPTISIFTQAAILASAKYLVPIKPDPLSVIGLPLLERWLSDYTEDTGIKIEPVGLVYTMVRGPLPTRMREIMDELRQDRGDQVFRSYLSVSTYIAQSVEDHEPIFRFAKSKNGKVGRQITDIVQEFADRTAGDDGE